MFHYINQRNQWMDILKNYLAIYLETSSLAHILLCHSWSYLYFLLWIHKYFVGSYFRNKYMYHLYHCTHIARVGRMSNINKSTMHSDAHSYTSVTFSVSVYFRGVATLWPRPRHFINSVTVVQTNQKSSYTVWYGYVIPHAVGWCPDSDQWWWPVSFITIVIALFSRMSRCRDEARRHAHPIEYRCAHGNAGHVKMISTRCYVYGNTSPLIGQAYTIPPSGNALGAICIALISSKNI